MDKQTFHRIYQRYGGEIRKHLYFRTVNEDLANDLTQDTFVKLWESQYSIDPMRVRSLLYKIAQDLFVDYVRKQKHQTDYLAEFQFRYKGNTDADEQNEEWKEACERALRSLTEKERTTFLMNKMEGQKYIEIAELLGIGVKAVEKRMSQALKKIKQFRYG